MMERRVSPVAPVRLDVWLFGSLAGLNRCQPLAIEVAPTASLGEALRALEQRLGPEFRERVMETPGVLFNCCRIFADGRSVQDLDAPLVEPGRDGAELELIVMTSAEGG